MQEIPDALLAFSDKKDLWNLTKTCALKAIDNYLERSRTDTLFTYHGMTSKNFVFSDSSQSLVFWQYNAPSLTIRTTIVIARDNSPNLFVEGEYCLDVDSEGNIVDETLNFF